MTTCVSDYLMRLFWLIYIFWLLSSHHFPLLRGYGARKNIGEKIRSGSLVGGKIRTL